MMLKDTVHLSPRRSHIIFLNFTYKVLKIERSEDSRFLRQIRTHDILNRL
jgi:hypothetical protein